MATQRRKAKDPLPDAEVRAPLIEAAIAARDRAYAKYSRFNVGAALLTAGGEIIVGCNVENVSYGLTICAERVAVFSAVAAGEQKFQALAVASAGGVTPCGACRQVLAEFAPGLEIWLVDVDRPNEWVLWNLADLLPGAFTFEPTLSQAKPRNMRQARKGSRPG
jgi:cytidine deaminase